MNMRTLRIAAVGAVMAGAAQAGTYHWTGAVDGAWTNANNWAEAKIPGQYYDATGTKTGAVGDTVYFDDAKLSGNKATTISFAGVYSVSNLYTTGSTRFTYGTAGSQYIPIEPFGTFSAAETATTPVATIACKLQTGVDFTTSSPIPTVSVRNNSAEELALTNEWGCMTRVGDTTSQACVTFEGSGSIRLGCDYKSSGGPQLGIYLNMTQPLVIGEGVKFTTRTIRTAKGLTALQRIELKKGASIVPLWYGAFFVSSSLELFGEGTFCYRVNGANSNYYEGSEVKEGATLTFNCPIKLQDDKAGTAYTYCYGAANGNGTIVYGCPSNDCTGTVIAKGAGSYVTFSQDSFGLKGTSGAMGDVDFEGGVLALRHTGAEADTTDRAVALAKVDATIPGKVKLEQAGAGAWTVNSAVSLKSGETSGQLVLAGAAGVGAATFGGSIASGISVTKTDGGTWTFAPQGGSVGAVSFNTGNAGTLVVGTDLTMASVSVASSSATLSVAAGKTLTINALTITSGRVLDIVLEDAAASVKLANATSVPAGLTLNGHAAAIGEDGTLTVDPNAKETIWKAATSGKWSEGTKWSKGAAPDGTVPVYVDANGADYAVTIDSAAGSSLALTNLVVDNAGAGTATVKIDGVPVTIKGNTATSAGAKTPLLTVGKGGAVEVKDAMLRLHDLGKEGTGLEGSSSLRQEGGSLTFTGTASLDHHPTSEEDLPSSTSKTTYRISRLYFGTGLTTFKDDASLSWTVQDTTYATCFHHVQPYLSGETAEVLFTDRSYINFKSSPRLFLQPNGGVSRLTIDTSCDKTLANAWGLCYVGYAGSGLAELNLKKGAVTMPSGSSFHVAVPGDDDNSMSAVPYVVTGRVDIASGASLFVGANARLNNGQFNGVQIGQGISSTCARGAALYHGELNVAGGYEQRRASLLVGTGPCGEGAITQTDGTVKVVTDPVKYPVNVASGTPAMNCAVALGAFGGQGSYTMTGGTFESGLPVYVGGILTNDLNRWHARGETFGAYHDAQGALTVSGGTFATTNSVVLGRDGTGVLTLSGAGVLKAAAIDVRQTDGAETSEIRFVADANGKCGKIDAATKLKFAAGSRVVVDVSAVSAENPKSIVLWNLDEAPEGLTEEMLVLQGNGSVAIENGLKLENGGRRLAWRVTRGLVLIIR